MKTFVIDTNVLINDPLAFYGFGPDNRVVVPLIVFQELDGLKSRKDGVGVAARTVAREIDKLRALGQLHQGIQLPHGGELMVYTDMNEPNFPVFGKVVADHYILQIVHENKGWILVTEDIFLRIQAESCDVPVERYENAFVESGSLYDETPELVWDQDAIDHLYNGDCYGIPDEELRILDKNRYAQLVSQETGKKAGLVRVNYETGNYTVVRGDNEVFGIKARNREQTFALNALMDPDITLVALAGKAGTGKTILALAAALQQAYEGDAYEKVTIAKPVVSMGKELGFLPGTLDEKLDPWMGSIHDSLSRLIQPASKSGKDKSPFSHMEHLRDLGVIDIQALQYIRGRSLPNQFVLIDEAQQLTPHEVNTIVTRAGEGTKVIFNGDPYQIDSPYLDLYNNGMAFLIDRFKGHDCFANVTLHKGERSALAELASQLLN
jgi:PhoH-like ATPase